jgi:hypothetical protein
MGYHDMPRSERRRKLFYDLEESVVVRDKDLDVVAHLGELGRRTDKVWHWARRPVPDECVEAFFAKNFPYSASDDAEAN